MLRFYFNRQEKLTSPPKRLSSLPHHYCNGKVRPLQNDEVVISRDPGPRLPGCCADPRAMTGHTSPCSAVCHLPYNTPRHSVTSAWHLVKMGHDSEEGQNNTKRSSCCAACLLSSKTPSYLFSLVSMWVHFIQSLDKAEPRQTRDYLSS